METLRHLPGSRDAEDVRLVDDAGDVGDLVVV